MIDQGKRIVAVLVFWLVAAMLSVALPTASGHCENLRFVFMADGRGNALDDQVNMLALEAINTQILQLNPRPAFVVYGGDSVYRGHSGGVYNFSQFETAMLPLTGAGIKVYTVIGNHELYREGTTGFSYANQQEFQKQFTNNPNPDNGPEGYKGLVYSFESPGGEAFFAIGDCYYLTADDPNPALNQEDDSSQNGTFDVIQLAWLENQLAKTKAKHKFFFAHAPYYKIVGSQSSQSTSFTELWSILDYYHVDLFGCGHEHLYSRKMIDYSIAPAPQWIPPFQWTGNVTQLLTGTCGAPIDDGTLVVDRYTWHVFNDFNAPNNYYYSVIDINGSKVSGTTYGVEPIVYTDGGPAPPFKVIDRFSIPSDVSFGIDLLLLQ
jgi:3',5'-cyclic AMP phosphodiesterase CpdA